MSLQKTAVRLLSTLAPQVMVNKAYDVLANPQQHKLREHELEVLQTATQQTIDFKGFQIRTYEWAGGNKPILLIHGWEGQAGNFADLIQHLQDHQYHIYTFDAPSHGFSSKGETSLLEFTELVGEMIRKTGSRKLISHSFGGVATTYALFNNPDLEIDKYALLTTPNRFMDRIEDVSQQVGITEKVKQRLIERIKTEVEEDITLMNVSEWVKDILVNEARIWHGKTDRILPLKYSQQVNDAWQASELQVIEDIGHFRILRDAQVIQEVVAFLKD
jgi:hypothetical protein